MLQTLGFPKLLNKSELSPSGWISREGFSFPWDQTLRPNFSLTMTSFKMKMYYHSLDVKMRIKTTEDIGS